jgi:hypothetical protein
MAKKSTKSTTKKTTARKPRTRKSTKVDYYPNRMTFAVAALAATVLVLFAVISVHGAYYGWN